MSATKQELLSLKKENLKLKENFKKFLKKHELNEKYITTKEKVKDFTQLLWDFMEEQETFIDNLNQQIDNIIVKDENRHEKTKISGVVSRKRRRSETSPHGNKNKASKRPHMEPKIVKNSLENFINNPGLQHLAENVFSNLNYQDITACQLINRSSRLILNNPGFWLKKFIQQGMSKKNQNDWIKAIQLTKNTKFERNIYLYLKRSLGMAKMVDIPCYIDNDIIQKYAENGTQDLEGKLYLKPGDLQNYIPGYIQMSIATVDGILVYDSSRNKRMMNTAAERGHLEVVKILASFLENSNASLYDVSHQLGNWTPIYRASRGGHLEIIKFLAPLSDNLTTEAINDARKIADSYHHNHVVRYFSSL